MLFKYILFLILALNLNSAQLILVAEKEQKQDSEYNKENDEFIKNGIGLKDQIHDATNLPKDVAKIITNYCDLSSLFNFPKFEKKSHDCNVHKHAFSDCLFCTEFFCCICKDYQCPRESVDYIFNQKLENNLKNGFDIASILIAIFDHSDQLNKEFLDSIYQKISDYEAVVTLIILGYMYFRSKQQPPQLCFGNNPINNDVVNNNYITINNIKISIAPFENNFSLETLVKIKNFLLHRNSLNKLAQHIKTTQDYDCKLCACSTFLCVINTLCLPFSLLPLIEWEVLCKGLCQGDTGEM